ncbi:MAG: YlxM family DNA-binding protein [Tepidanaerobacteraceae bacterium]|nr:YlxM family DNA-binding protein [Tepidanaerobacteraceae bacterium]
MDERTKINLLYDFYGDFLTQKQKEVFELHFLNDLSLGEIAENYGVTRQGIHDILKRAQEILTVYEKKLGMVQRYANLEKKVHIILKSLNELESGLSEEHKNKVRQIREEVALLLKEGGEQDGF